MITESPYITEEQAEELRCGLIDYIEARSNTKAIDYMMDLIEKQDERISELEKQVVDITSQPGKQGLAKLHSRIDQIESISLHNEAKINSHIDKNNLKEQGYKTYD